MIDTYITCLNCSFLLRVVLLASSVTVTFHMAADASPNFHFSNTWAIFYFPSRWISRNQNQKWISRNLNPHSGVGCHCHKCSITHSTVMVSFCQDTNVHGFLAENIVRLNAMFSEELGINWVLRRYSAFSKQNGVVWKSVTLGKIILKFFLIYLLV